MSASLQDEYTLIARWKNGDEKAFDQLFNLHFHKLHQFALRHTHDHSLAEELVMDMMFKVWQKKDVLETGSVSLAPFLFHILKAAIIDHYRKKRIELVAIDPSQQEAIAATSADDSLHHSELNTLYQESLSLLTPQRRLVLEMRQEQGLTYKEIARQLNISPKTVDRHLATSISIVRKYMLKHTHITLLFLSLAYV